MIPWCFAYDCMNCAHYLPWYLKNMTSLSSSHPQVNEFLEKGGLSVQLGSVNKLGRIPMDQAIEETANRGNEGIQYACQCFHKILSYCWIYMCLYQ